MDGAVLGQDPSVARAYVAGLVDLVLQVRAAPFLEVAFFAVSHPAEDPSSS